VKLADNYYAILTHTVCLFNIWMQTGSEDCSSLKVLNSKSLSRSYLLWNCYQNC